MYFLTSAVLLVCLSLAACGAAWAGADLYAHWDDDSTEAAVTRREATLSLFKPLLLLPFVIVASLYRERWGDEILMLILVLFTIWFFLWRRLRGAKRRLREEQGALQPPLRPPRSPHASYAEQFAGVWEVEDQQYVLTPTEDRKWVLVTSPAGSDAAPEWIIRHGRKLDARSR